MLRSLDLFSGIGGNSYALRDILKPIAYVEREQHLRDFLGRKFPDVPIFDDVVTFDTRSVKDIDIITAGFPCTGFSTAGKGDGFEHEASGLFTEVVRIAKELEPRFVFLENSHTVARIENLHVIIDAFDVLGYDCRWTTTHATAVGAPQQRHRWFCLAVRRGESTDINIPDVDHFDWTNDEPAKQIENIDSRGRKIIQALGNSIVPDQLRSAFKTIMSMDFDGNETQGSKRIPHGYSIRGKIFKKNIINTEREPMNILICQSEPPQKHKGRLPHIDKKIKRFWATPVKGTATKGQTILTRRSLQCLGTLVRFSPDGISGWHLNPFWVGYLMGYRRDFFEEF